MKKMHGCGNKFIVVDEHSARVKDRKRFVLEHVEREDVDGVLFVCQSDKADLEMKIFDRDGTEETMCGNGIRCFARYAYDEGYIGTRAKILTGDGVKGVQITGNLISVDMGSPRDFKKLGNSQYFVFTGVPHYVWFKDELNLEEARKLGREIRYNSELCASLNHEGGVNVNFVKLNSPTEIEILTYEVGVEDVTNACGTGSTAAAYVSHMVKNCKFPIIVRNRGGDLVIDLRRNRLIMTGNAEYL